MRGDIEMQVHLFLVYCRREPGTLESNGEVKKLDFLASVTKLPLKGFVCSVVGEKGEAKFP